MNKIYIGNLPFDTSREQLESLFAEYGNIDEVYLVRDRKTRRTKGYGFVTFDGQEQAQSALALDGEAFNGRTLRVSIAKEKELNDGVSSTKSQGKGQRSQRMLSLLGVLLVAFAVSYYVGITQEHQLTQANQQQLSRVQHHLHQVDKQLALLEKHEHIARV